MTETSTFTYTGERYSTERLIGRLQGGGSGPKVVFIGAMHGNEPSGVIALKRVLGELEDREIQGDILAVVGNMTALDRGRRFLDRDLNRMWSEHEVSNLRATNGMAGECGGEIEEQRELIRLFDDFVEEGRPTYFIDLHTTSGASMPFMSISRTTANLNFATSIHVPIVVGIERFIKGPLLDYMSSQGHVSTAFEAGQHDTDEAVHHQVLFIREVLSQLGVCSLDGGINAVGRVPIQGRFELRYRHDITEVTDFRMRPGYTNFDKVMKGEVLATEGEKEIQSPCRGRIFMPLYQEEGDDGFFIINRP